MTYGEEHRAWGPYSKRLAGLSHVAGAAYDQKDSANSLFVSGMRVDFSIFPSLYRRSIEAPNVNWESGYYPRYASQALDAFSFRFELSHEDGVYVDVAYTMQNRASWRYECTLRNESKKTASLAMHVLSALHAPTIGPRLDQELAPDQVELSSGGKWVDALSGTLTYARVNPQDSLVYDSLERGQFFAHGFCNGTGIELGRDPGDQYLVEFAASDLEASHVYARLCAAESASTPGESARLAIGNDVIEVSQAPLSLRRLPESAVQEAIATGGRLTITYRGGAALRIDGFAIVPAGAGAPTFGPLPVDSGPTVTIDSEQPAVELSFDSPLKKRYRITGAFARAHYRELADSGMDSVLKRLIHDHVNPVLFERWRVDANVMADKRWAYGTVAPISVGPGEERLLSGEICEVSNGAEVRASSAAEQDAQPRGAHLATGTQPVEPLPEWMQITEAVMLTNVVFPVYCKGRYIRHFTPGKWWDSLYTWDAGFVGIGLAEINAGLALECLTEYLCDPDDEAHAFVHHGSPVPVQFYLFWELWNKTQSLELVRALYPRLRHYYLFYVGKAGSSTMDKHRSGLLASWDYFYNSGGWDDYPPQQHVHAAGLEATVAPVAMTAHAGSIARIMAKAARLLGADSADATLSAHLGEYLGDIERFSEAVERHAWDEASGYYGYVVHDDAGRPREILRTPDGDSYNRGMDGLTPLYAGLVSEAARRERLFEPLSDPEALQTPIGLTTVDQSASYYTPEGYWNGAVWMPHQWFFWKACLDYRRFDLATWIAQTALAVWRREVEASHRCFEHFVVQTGRGAGWHHFGGLSSPVLQWYHAYNTPGTVNLGFAGTLLERRAEPGRLTLTYSFRDERRKGESMTAGLLVVPPEEGEWRATCNRTDVPLVSVPDTGAVYVEVEGDQTLEFFRT